MQIERLIETYKFLQFVLPFNIGGSFALYLMGYDLKRPLNDLDLIVPQEKNDYNWKYFSKKIPESMLISLNLEGGSDDYECKLRTSDGLKIDIGYKPEQINFKDIIFKGQVFRVSDLKYIIDAKLKYAFERGIPKHHEDLKLLKEQGCPYLESLSENFNSDPVELDLPW